MKIFQNLQKKNSNMRYNIIFGCPFQDFIIRIIFVFQNLNEYKYEYYSFLKTDEYEYEYYSFGKNGRIRIRIVIIRILFE